MNTPLSQTTDTLKLEEIRRRCEELDKAPQELLELTLEEPDYAAEGSDPYNRSRL